MPSCPQCGKDYSSNSTLNRHLKTCQGAPPGPVDPTQPEETSCAETVPVEKVQESIEAQETLHISTIEDARRIADRFPDTEVDVVADIDICKLPKRTEIIYQHAPPGSRCFIDKVQEDNSIVVIIDSTRGRKRDIVFDPAMISVVIR